ncbi:MAG: hypothetical protein WCK49_05300 [Myxococcaceae bacterium]
MQALQVAAFPEEEFSQNRIIVLSASIFKVALQFLFVTTSAIVFSDMGDVSQKLNVTENPLFARAESSSLAMAIVGGIALFMDLIVVAAYADSAKKIFEPKKELLVRYSLPAVLLAIQTIVSSAGVTYPLAQIASLDSSVPQILEVSCISTVDTVVQMTSYLLILSHFLIKKYSEGASVLGVPVGIGYPTGLVLPEEIS